MSPDNANDPEYNIYLDYLADFSEMPNIDYMQSDQFFVYNYNNIVGDDFQVYYTEQAANFIVPQEPGGVGSPVAGMTNEEEWNAYGTAIAGAVAPSTATTQAGILGLVEPI